MTEPSTSPILNSMAALLSAFREMLEATSTAYREPQDPTDAAANGSADKLLKGAVPIVLQLVASGIQHFSNELKSPRQLTANPIEAITAAKEEILSREGLAKILNDAIAKMSALHVLNEQAIQSILNAFLAPPKGDKKTEEDNHKSYFEEILRQIGICNFDAVSKELSGEQPSAGTQSSQKPYMIRLTNAIKCIEIRDLKAAENMSRLIEILESQVRGLFENTENAKKINELVSPLVAAVASSMGYSYGGIGTGIAKLVVWSFSPVCKYLLSWLGLTGNEFSSPTSYADLVKKILLHAFSELKTQIKAQEERIRFEENMKNADFALRELRDKLQTCKEMISQPGDSTIDVVRLCDEIKISSIEISEVLIEQQAKLTSTKEELKRFQEKISELLLTPQPWTTEQLIELIKHKPTTPNLLPPELFQVIEETILATQREAAQQGIVAKLGSKATAPITATYGLVTWALGSKPAATKKDRDLRAAVDSLQTAVTGKIAENQTTLENNQHILDECDSLIKKANKLKPLTAKAQQLLSLENIDQKIASIQEGLKSYHHSFQHFFGWLANAFNINNKLTSKYNKYKNLRDRLETLLKQKNVFTSQATKKVKETAQGIAPSDSGEDINEDINIDEALKNTEEDKKYLNTTADDIRRDILQLK